MVDFGDEREASREMGARSLEPASCLMLDFGYSMLDGAISLVKKNT